MLVHHSRKQYSPWEIQTIARQWQKKMMDRWADALQRDRQIAYDETDHWEMAREIRVSLELVAGILEAEGAMVHTGSRRDLILAATSRDIEPSLDAFLTLAAFVYPSERGSVLLPHQLAYASVGYTLGENCMPGGILGFVWQGKALAAR